MIISLATMIFSVYKIIKYKLETKVTNEEITNLEIIADVEEFDDSTPVNDGILSADETSESFYWKYLKTPFINVNLDALKQENNEVVGWLQVLGTNINYPFVQTADNRFYLYHTFDRSANSAGWVFLDYRNKNDLSDKNNIVYAHGRLDNTMFGSLRNLLTSDWIKDPNNYLIRTKTENASEIWQIFSIYLIPTTSDYLQTAFRSNEEFSTFLEMLKSRSSYNFSTDLSPEDKILTLSTCYDDDKKIVVHAKLIKISNI